MKFENQKKVDVVEARAKAILKEITTVQKPLDSDRVTEINTLLSELINITNEEIKS